jgi:hypothetical protein
MSADADLTGACLKLLRTQATLKRLIRLAAGLDLTVAML